jgi:hypothetical protein
MPEEELPPLPSFQEIMREWREIPPSQRPPAQRRINADQIDTRRAGPAERIFGAINANPFENLAPRGAIRSLSVGIERALKMLETLKVQPNHQLLTFRSFSTDIFFARTQYDLYGKLHRLAASMRASTPPPLVPTYFWSIAPTKRPIRLWIQLLREIQPRVKLIENREPLLVGMLNREADPPEIPRVQGENPGTLDRGLQWLASDDLGRPRLTNQRPR